MHYGPKKRRIDSHPIIYAPTGEGVSKVSEWASKWAQRRAQAQRVVQSKQTSERTSEWPSTAVWILDYSGQLCNAHYEALVRTIAPVHALVRTM